MAIDPQPGPVGQRLAHLRARKRLTAAQLADRIPGSSVTKTIITNVESGRKLDLTVSELLAIASALETSPLALVVDADRPWEPLPFPGLADRESRLTAAEYARAANMFALRLSAAGGFAPHLSDFLENLISAEVAFDSAAFIAEEPDIRDTDSSWGMETAAGEPFVVWGTSDPDQKCDELIQEGIDAYRAALIARRQADRWDRSRIDSSGNSFEPRTEA